MRDSWVAPDACTLPTAEQPLRAAEFDDLFAANLVGMDRTAPTRLTLRFAGGHDLAAMVRALAHRETACCSFFDFRVTALAGPELTAVRLEVRVPPSRVEVLTALGDRAERLGLGARS